MKFVSYPLDTLKKITQATPNPPSVTKIAEDMIKKDGITSLWRGYKWALLKIIPWTTFLLAAERIAIEQDYWFF
jgi:hypothetical protein